MATKSRKDLSALIPSLTLAAGILICIQTFTLERLKLMMVRESDVGALNLSFGSILRLIVENLRPIDAVLLASFAALLLWLILRELRQKSTSADLADALASERRSLLLLAVMGVAACRFYLSPGQFSLGDSLCHVSRVWAAADSFARGHWPFWSFFNYAGYPLLQFYGPLFFVIGGAAANLVGNVEWTTKVFLFLLHSGSAFPMYWWARSVGLSRQAAFVGALAYILTFQHTHTIVWTGALPVAVIYFLFPCVLLAAEKIAARPSARWVVFLSIGTAGLILGHNGYAAQGLQLVLLYVLLRWVLHGACRMEPMRVLTIVLGIAGGVLLCSGFLWPVIAEGKWVYQPTEIPFLLPGVPTIEFLKKLFVWRNLASGWTVAYLGISMVGFALIGGCSAWRRRGGGRETQILRVSGVVAVLAILCAARSGRVANLAVPFVALLAGALAEIRSKGPAPRLTLALVAILLVDLGPTTIQLPFRTDRQFLRDGLKLAARAIYPHRALVADASPSGTHFSHWGYYDGTGLILPTGFFPQGAPRSLNGIDAMIDALNMPQGIRPSARIDLLYLWDVAGLIAHTRHRFVEPDIEETQADARGIPFARLSPASPIVFSERIALALDDSLKELQKRQLLMQYDENDPSRRAYVRLAMRWVERMALDREKRTARVIFLESGEEEAWPPDGWSPGQKPVPHVESPGGLLRDGASDEDGGGPDGPDVAQETLPPAGSETAQAPFERAAPDTTSPMTIARCETELQRVSIGYHAPKDGFLRLAYSWYPALRVLVDGAPVTPLRSVLGAIVIPTTAGSHDLELIAFETKTRLWSLIAGIGAGACCTLLAARIRKRH
jgi:Ca2+/Na+ antiporter